MRAAIRLPLAVIAAALLLLWVISVAGATGWSLTVNWAIFLVAAGLLALRAAA